MPFFLSRIGRRFATDINESDSAFRHLPGAQRLASVLRDMPPPDTEGTACAFEAARKICRYVRNIRETLAQDGYHGNFLPALAAYEKVLYDRHIKQLIYKYKHHPSEISIRQKSILKSIYDECGFIPFARYIHYSGMMRMIQSGGGEEDSNIVVSVVIPMYNSSQYIERCLRSVQNALREGVEVIMVDDGSEDDTIQISRKWAEQYANFRLHVLPRNAGPLIARLEGTNLARGKYIFFLDSDDQVSAGLFEFFLKGALECDADIVQVEIEGGQHKRRLITPFAKFARQYEMFMYPSRESAFISTSMTRKFYKKGIIEVSSPYFPKHKLFYEDNLSNSIIIAFSHHFKITCFQGYKINYRSNSVSRSNNALTHIHRITYPYLTATLIKRYFITLLDCGLLSMWETEKHRRMALIARQITRLDDAQDRIRERKRACSLIRKLDLGSSCILSVKIHFALYYYYQFVYIFMSMLRFLREKTLSISKTSPD